MDKPLPPEVGDRVRRLRLASGETQAELGARLELSNSTICLIEGNSYSPRLDLVFSLAQAYGLTVEELLDDRALNARVRELLSERKAG